jgi:hypothetical protein
MGLHSAVVSLTLYAASEMLAYIILRLVLSMVCAAGVILMKHCVLTTPAASTAERRERCPVYLDESVIQGFTGNEGLFDVEAQAKTGWETEE